MKGKKEILKSLIGEVVTINVHKMSNGTYNNEMLLEEFTTNDYQYYKDYKIRSIIENDTYVFLNLEDWSC